MKASVCSLGNSHLHKQAFINHDKGSKMKMTVQYLKVFIIFINYVKRVRISSFPHHAGVTLTFYYTEVCPHWLSTFLRIQSTLHSLIYHAVFKLKSRAVLKIFPISQCNNELEQYSLTLMLRTPVVAVRSVYVFPIVVRDSFSYLETHSIPTLIIYLKKSKKGNHTLHMYVHRIDNLKNIELQK